MNSVRQQRFLFLAPMALDTGLTSVALGLVRALERAGIKTGFVKPIAQPEKDAPVEASTRFARMLCHVEAPESIPFSHAEEMFRTGQLGELLEEVVKVVDSACAGNQMVVIEGLTLDVDAQLASRLNVEMARSQSAALIPVLSGGRLVAHEVAEIIELARSEFLPDGGLAMAGVIINKVPNVGVVKRLRDDLQRMDVSVPVLGAVPFEPRLTAPRLIDVVHALNLKVENGANLTQSRVQEIVVAARSVENVIDRMRPGALVVTPGDRHDIILAAIVVAQQGTPLAGLLLTCGEGLSEQIAALLPSGRTSGGGLPILATDEDTFATASLLAKLDTHCGPDDGERMDRVIDFVADHIDTGPLAASLDEPSLLRLTPAVFRHLLVQSAAKVGKRIVLPEGDEPRTIRAAAICHTKGIAHCILLGDPQRIRQGAIAQGVSLPDDVEIIDAAAIRARYVNTLVELRVGKSLTVEQAEEQLEDNVVLGTVMLALGEVDGLVSGAVHTTANTVRPALQLIKTAPGNSIVSSVFFMLMPDQVLVYGDCAINPSPTAVELAEIALQSADSAKAFGIEPRVAMLSYSTGTSGSGDDVEKVREATKLVRERRPELIVDGPLQYDAASVESVGRQKAPGSLAAGRANVFVFPDLNTGNTTYKAVQRTANVVSVGPMLQGLNKPVNDLSRGALVDDIVYTIALTAIQAANPPRG